MLLYEYMPRGSLENHLSESLIGTFSWSQRLKIAVEAAKGLAYLHDAEKPLIYSDFKPSYILLDSDYTAKLDFGLARDGYSAPEFIAFGHVSAKSDVYTFGMILLELLTGRSCTPLKFEIQGVQLTPPGLYWIRP